MFHVLIDVPYGKHLAMPASMLPQAECFRLVQGGGYSNKNGYEFSNETVKFALVHDDDIGASPRKTEDVRQALEKAKKNLQEKLDSLEQELSELS